MQRTDREDGDTSHIEALASDDVRQPTAHRQHDRCCDEVASDNPGAFVGARPHGPGHLGKATLAIEESRTSMNVANVTVMAMIHGLIARRVAGMASRLPLLQP